MGVPSGARGFSAWAILTSLAVQFSFWWNPAALNSSCKQFCANASGANVVRAKSEQQNSKSDVLLLKSIFFLLCCGLGAHDRPAVPVRIGERAVPGGGPG